MRGPLERRLARAWFRPEPPAWPVRVLARGLAPLLRRRGRRPQARPPVPVVVVGNLVVGGTGKTPVVAALAEALGEAGRRVGIVSRGYGGIEPTRPMIVDDATPASACGDEPRELRLRTGCPVFVCARRDRALEAAVAAGCDAVLSDDGLQHRALPRSLELCLFDGRRGLGNGEVLPAGPLRQPIDRLDEVDHVLVRAPREAEGLPEDAREFRLRAEGLRRFAGEGGQGVPEPPSVVDAVAGIARPESFFETLSSLGFGLRRHPLPDHAPIPDALLRGLAGPVVVTAKDAARLDGPQREDLYVLDVRAELPAEVRSRVVDHVLQFGR